MSAGALFEIDAVHNKTGYSVFLHEQVREPSSGWASPARSFHLDITPDPQVLDFAAARSATQRRTLLTRAGGGLTIKEVATRLGIQEPDVDRLRVTERLLAVPDPDGEEWLYPACQFDAGRIVPGLDEVIGEFGVRSAWTRLYVLMSSDPALGGRSPIEALKDGDLEAVRWVVHGYGQQGAA